MIAESFVGVFHCQVLFLLCKMSKIEASDLWIEGESRIHSVCWRTHSSKLALARVERYINYVLKKHDNNAQQSMGQSWTIRVHVGRRETAREIERRCKSGSNLNCIIPHIVKNRLWATAEKGWNRMKLASSSLSRLSEGERWKISRITCCCCFIAEVSNKERGRKRLKRSRRA